MCEVQTSSRLQADLHFLLKKNGSSRKYKKNAAFELRKSCQLAKKKLNVEIFTFIEFETNRKTVSISFWRGRVTESVTKGLSF